MAVVFSVLGDSPDEAVAALRLLCERFGLEPSGPPLEVVGRGKWLGRARAAPSGPGNDAAPAR